MPLYDYRCANGHTFEARHGFNDPAPACPECGEAHVQRVITSAPGVMQGINASAGKNASKADLQSKWAEETPKLREKLVNKLGEDTVNKYAPTLNTKYD
ncbi:MAG: zinc ribbon domain-containing protein [Chloroflexi bacterium]|uniref:FmdB family zinc ribbon protein n=1 Tax=Candidatus Flexifilum breve TaxID=3140694 RepID=UPI0031372A3B|nr:zinc ribbon domain-containing protein [Chloroflexota bacterium]MBK9750579.1 zinc ribbon domain-containing protein [Chloroflexota bacterium]